MEKKEAEITRSTLQRKTSKRYNLVLLKSCRGILTEIKKLKKKNKWFFFFIFFFTFKNLLIFLRFLCRDRID